MVWQSISPAEGERAKMPPRQQVKVNEEDVIHTMKDGIGSVNFLDRVQQQMKEAMGFSVVVSPLGKIVRYHALLNRLYAIWRPKGEIEITDSFNGHYVVRLSL